MARILFSCIVIGVLGAGTAWAHHEVPGRSHAVATVTIDQQVLAGGEPLAPGTYEVWISDQRPAVGAGAPSALQRTVEFVQNGKVVAKEIAEVFPREGEVVGTSGTAGMGKATVQLLKSGDFVRVSVNDAANRYLIHLPTGRSIGPEPQPQPPARIELVFPPVAVPVPQPEPTPR